MIIIVSRNKDPEPSKRRRPQQQITTACHPQTGTRAVGMLSRIWLRVLDNIIRKSRVVGSTQHHQKQVSRRILTTVLSSHSKTQNPSPRISSTQSPCAWSNGCHCAERPRLFIRAPTNQHHIPELVNRAMRNENKNPSTNRIGPIQRLIRL